MSDCFDHAADAWDDLLFGRSADEWEDGIPFGPSLKTCTHCGTKELHWQKFSLIANAISDIINLFETMIKSWFHAIYMYMYNGAIQRLPERIPKEMHKPGQR